MLKLCKLSFRALVVTWILLRGHRRGLDVVSAAEDADPGDVGDVKEEEADGDLDGGEFFPYKSVCLLELSLQKYQDDVSVLWRQGEGL